MLLNYFFHRRRQGEDAELNEPPVLVFCYPEGLCLLSTVVVRTDTHIFSEVTLFFLKKSVYPSQRLCSCQGSVEVPVERKKSRWCSWCRKRNQQGRAGQDGATTQWEAEHVLQRTGWPALHSQPPVAFRCIHQLRVNVGIDCLLAYTY
jgi:hypothetical protein